MAQPTEGSAAPVAESVDGNQSRAEMEYLTPCDLQAGPGPVGSGRICATLAAAGIRISEATAARLLRSLDRQGYTQPLGVKGRVLTDRGRQRLAELEQAHRCSQLHHSLIDATRVETIEDILDLLGTRRAVESETARLAALRATAEELVAIEQAARAHLAAIQAGENVAPGNCAFHLLIARASKSRALLAVAELLFQNEQLQAVQAHIQRAIGAVAPDVHLPLLQSLKDRQPERAADAMRVHIDSLIRVVQDYQASTPGRPSSGDASGHSSAIDLAAIVPSSDRANR